MTSAKHETVVILTVAFFILCIETSKDTNQLDAIGRVFQVNK